MPKKKDVEQNKKIDLEKAVMEKVQTGQVKMKPKGYFVAGSALMVAGLAGLGMVAVFLANLSWFLVRKHGPMGQWRLTMMLANFPWWVPVTAVAALAAGVWLLAKYDFSYKKNFRLVVAGLVAGVLLAGWMVDRLGLNEAWARRGMMRRLYMQLDEGAGYEQNWEQGEWGQGRKNWQRYN